MTFRVNSFLLDNNRTVLQCILVSSMYVLRGTHNARAGWLRDRHLAIIGPIIYFFNKPNTGTKQSNVSVILDFRVWSLKFKPHSTLERDYIIPNKTNLARVNLWCFRNPQHCPRIPDSTMKGIKSNEQKYENVRRYPTCWRVSYYVHRVLIM